MGIMDFLVGKEIGTQQARNKQQNADTAVRRARHDADVAEMQVDYSHNAALAIAVELKNTREELAITRKRFFKERQERKAWRKTAEFRKLSLLNHGLTEEQIYAEQDMFDNNPEIDGRTDRIIDSDTAKIDAEFLDNNTSNPSNNLSMN
ncbi:hypothetical protein HHS34_005675 [Acidithiobacillus montserratensis]|uniref:Uncharacterized protein n=1 Tax=Acidithiobacillus montserratensis TaxID=2729135 RepID=A0ACD5HJ45_9PROT|nr:hypothetical protein [Acidithiobacillus montserratensis]MBU2747834.1 hypothetical protein [Acidithiobacillus montserratensis]